jgi:hypothetical protein
MKNWIWPALLLFSSAATAYTCPSGMNEEQAKLQRWLEPWRGVHELKGCRIEITVCAPDQTEETGAVLAEVYVTDDKGREAYVPLTGTDSARIQSRARYYPRTLNYLKRDKYREAEFGRTETTRLEITLMRDRSGIESLDFGIYATNKPLRWLNCGR